MQLHAEAGRARALRQLHRANIGRPLAIVLDNRVMSAPTIQGRITDSGQITGITPQEMHDLVLTLKSGALPASMTYLEERDGRARRSAPTRFAPASRPRSAASRSSCCSCSSTTS